MQMEMQKKETKQQQSKPTPGLFVGQADAALGWAGG